MRPVALITGGVGDLAQALKLELERQGWDVVTPARTEMDVTNKEQIQACFGRVPRLDMLVHSAGVLRDATLSKMDEEAFDQVQDVHLRGGFLCAQAALKLMTRQRDGHLVFVGSYSALSGPAGQANYAAAKAGLIGLTKSLASEYGALGVRANCVLPGFLDTRMTRHLLSQEPLAAKVLGAHALGRLNTVEDAARFIVFLHSMSHVSGQVFQLDSRASRWA